MGDNISDKELVRNCITGDENAWRELVEKNSSLVILLIKKTLTSLGVSFCQDDIDDIYENIFDALLENNSYLLRSYNSKYKLSTYLGVIASTQCYRYLRKKQIPTVSLDYETEDEEGALSSLKKTKSEILPGPEQEYEINERKQKIKESLSRLPVRDQLILTMLFIDGMKYSEIGQTLQIPTSHISKTIFRAKEKLKKELENKNIF